MYKKLIILLLLFTYSILLFPGTSLGAMTYRGIDVSHYQGNIGWAQVASDDVDFVIVKATEGTTFIDSKFYQNVTGALNNNIAAGAYHFARFTNVEEAEQEADFFLSVISGVPLNYAVAVDLEVTDGLSSTVLTNAVQAFLEKVQGARVYYYINIQQSKLPS